MRKKHLYWKRGIAMALAAAMVFAGFPSNVKAVDRKVQAAVRFDFNSEPVNGKFTSGDVTAEVLGGYSLAERDEANGKALYLDGSSGYLNVTKSDGKSPLAGLTEATISFDTRQDRTATNWAFYAAPDTAKPANGKEHYLGALINGGKLTVERYNNTNGRPTNPSVTIGNDWVHVDVVVSQTATTLYVNGLKRAAQDSSYALTDILGSAGGILQIGKANWGSGEYYRGWIDNFEITNSALAEQDITTDEIMRAAVRADADAIQLPETVKKDFSLPASGANGSAIRWAVSAADGEGCIQIEGNTAKVTQSMEKEQQAQLTAKVSLTSASGASIEEERSFTVKVEQLLDDLQSAKKQLTIPNMDNIRGNITLPAEFEIEEYAGVKAAVTWKSDNMDVITDIEKDGKPAGVVTRQETDTKVKLTATITVNGRTDTKELTVTVKAACKPVKTTDYLFAFFENNGGPAEQQIFFASSHDGNNWMDLNDKKPVLSVADSVRSPEDLAKNQNQAGVRDPYMIRSPEGDRFWLIATDLCIGENNIAAGTVDWGVSQYSGSHCLRIWESDDLVNWSKPWLADVAPADTTCAWAPEAVYDDTTGEYVVFFASMTGKVQKVYYAKTRDFKTFAEPVKMVDNGDDHIIDTTILKAEDGTYYRGSAADGSIRVEKCRDGNWKGLDSWEIQGSIRDIAGFRDALEGPELFKYNEDDYKEVNGKKVPTYGLLADNYGKLGYVPFYTTDIANADWKQTAAGDYNFDTVHKRHGGILNLTAEEYDRVMGAYGRPESIEVKTAPQTLTYNTVRDRYTPSELVLTVKYSNNRQEEAAYSKDGKNSEYFRFSGVEPKKEGTQEITVTYGGKSAKFITDVKIKAPAVQQEEKVLADFTFDNEEDGFISDNARAQGSYSLRESYAKSKGKALYLNGSASNYLTVTGKDGKSLLAGLSEMTVSYDMKPDRTQRNWVLYAAADDRQQTYNSEQYIGILEDNGSTSAERYLNFGVRPGCPSADTGSGWYHVDVVFAESGTVVYVNGVKVQEMASAYDLWDILDEAGVLYIGKANWGDNGEYFQGYLDNFRILNKALDETRIPADTQPKPDPEPEPEPMKPGRVSGLKAAPSAASVKLSWKAVSGADGYEIYRAKSTSKKYAKVKTIVKGSTTAYTDTKLAKTTGYQYKVRAYKNGTPKAYGEYSGVKKVVTTLGKASGAKVKRVGKASKKTKALFELKKVANAGFYQIEKYNKSKKKYEAAYKIQGKKLYQYNAKTKKYKKIGKAADKKGKLSCTLTGLNLKKEKSMKFRVRAAKEVKGYGTIYGAYGKAATLK